MQVSGHYVRNPCQFKGSHAWSLAFPIGEREISHTLVVCVLGKMPASNRGTSLVNSRKQPLLAGRERVELPRPALETGPAPGPVLWFAGKDSNPETVQRTVSDPQQAGQSSPEGRATPAVSGGVALSGRHSLHLEAWFAGKDSNLDFLVQSQASYQLDDPRAV